MEKNFIEDLYQAHKNVGDIPPPERVCKVINGLLKILFPELADHKYETFRSFEQHYRAVKLELYNILFTIRKDLVDSPESIEHFFLEALPDIRTILLKDAHAILKGDPAANSLTEVIRTYPGFFAIAVFRLAHQFYLLKVPLIPRILTEFAHAETGIDIHPGANIDHSFCIDHGTGVVIGETVDIGQDVKIYQGVTLGALSVKKEMAKIKRHPTIGNNVVIYAGATILGGDTTIGHDSIIGGNVWITKSIPPYSRIYYKGNPVISTAKPINNEE